MDAQELLHELVLQEFGECQVDNHHGVNVLPLFARHCLDTGEHWGMTRVTLIIVARAPAVLERLFRGAPRGGLEDRRYTWWLEVVDAAESAILDQARYSGWGVCLPLLDFRYPPLSDPGCVVIRTEAHLEFGPCGDLFAVPELTPRLEDYLREKYASEYPELLGGEVTG